MANQYANEVHERAQAKEHHFNKDANQIKRHVMITVPNSNNHAKAQGKIGKPVAKDWPASALNHSDKPSRLLMNLAFEHPEQRDKFVNDFDPPIHLRIPLEAGEQGEGSKMMYWDGSHWTEVPDGWVVKSSGRKYWVENDHFVVQLSHWPDDPPSGMAP